MQFIKVILLWLKENKSNLLIIKIFFLFLINLWWLFVYYIIINIENANIINNNPIIVQISEQIIKLLQEYGWGEISPNIIKLLIISLVIIVTNLTVLYYSKMFGMILLGIFVRYSNKCYNSYLINQESFHYMGFENLQNNKINIEKLIESINSMKKEINDLKQSLASLPQQTEVIQEVIKHEEIIQPEVIEAVVQGGINWWYVGGAVGVVAAAVIAWYLISKGYLGEDCSKWWNGEKPAPSAPSAPAVPVVEQQQVVEPPVVEQQQVVEPPVVAQQQGAPVESIVSVEKLADEDLKFNKVDKLYALALDNKNNIIVLQDKIDNIIMDTEIEIQGLNKKIMNLELHVNLYQKVDLKKCKDDITICKNAIINIKSNTERINTLEKQINNIIPVDTKVVSEIISVSPLLEGIILVLRQVYVSKFKN